MCLSRQAFFVSEFQLKASVFFSPLIKLPLVNEDHRKKISEKFSGPHLHTVNILLQKVHKLAQWVGRPSRITLMKKTFPCGKTQERFHQCFEFHHSLTPSVRQPSSLSPLNLLSLQCQPLQCQPPFPLFITVLGILLISDHLPPCQGLNAPSQLVHLPLCRLPVSRSTSLPHLAKQSSGAPAR